MLGAGKLDRRGVIPWLLLVLTGLGLASLAFPQTADGEVTTAWVRIYQGTYQSSNTSALMAMDGQGNVFRVWSGSRPPGYAMIKYSPDGEEIWLRNYFKPEEESRQFTALVLDGQGNIYLTGTLNNHCVTIKHDAEGRQLWVRRNLCPAHRYDRGVALAVDGQGNVLVTGSAQGNQSDTECLTIKYDPGGRQLWMRRYHHQDDYGNTGVAVAVDVQGNAYVAASGFILIKYAPDGQPLWVRRITGTVADLVLDSQGNICLTGVSHLGQGDYSYLTTIKYSPAGRRLWVRLRHWPPPSYYSEYYQGRSLVVDSQDNFLVFGTAVNPNGPASGRSVILKYSPAGQLLWRRFPQYYIIYSENQPVANAPGPIREPGPGQAAGSASPPDAGILGGPEVNKPEVWASFPDQSHHRYLNVDLEGNVYLALGSLLKYSADGKPLWAVRFSLPDGVGNISSLAVDDQGDVYGAGSNYTVKYRQSP